MVLGPVVLDPIEFVPSELNPIEFVPSELNPIEFEPIELSPIEFDPPSEIEFDPSSEFEPNEFGPSEFDPSEIEFDPSGPSEFTPTTFESREFDPTPMVLEAEPIPMLSETNSEEIDPGCTCRGEIGFGRSEEKTVNSKGSLESMSSSMKFRFGLSPIKLRDENDDLRVLIMSV